MVLLSGFTIQASVGGSKEEEIMHEHQIRNIILF